MKLSNIDTATATAIRIGKSKKESISVDGSSYIKSCNVGLWNFLVVCEYDTYNYMTKQPECRICCVSTKHRDEYAAKESINSSVARDLKFKKDSGYDLNARHRIVEIVR